MATSRQPLPQQPKPKTAATFQHSLRLARAKALEFHLVSGFKEGYRNREDVTVLPEGVLVAGSQNVMTNTFKRVDSSGAY